MLNARHWVTWPSYLIILAASWTHEENSDREWRKIKRNEKYTKKRSKIGEKKTQIRNTNLLNVRTRLKCIQRRINMSNYILIVSVLVTMSGKRSHVVVMHLVRILDLTKRAEIRRVFVILIVYQFLRTVVGHTIHGGSVIADDWYLQIGECVSFTLGSSTGGFDRTFVYGFSFSL